ncbi:MAG TPA: Dyp-type peroxidase [Solirubrobacteraceae bacterium]|jgi:Dyp-type peroxidase family|nr:Dyp-type peroxidase [Solirubrobacteraceae bacterium]
MARDLDAEPLLPSAEIQGDILVGLTKKFETLLFFSIDDASAFTAFLKGLDLTTQEDSLAIRDLIKKRRDQGIKTVVPTPGLNVAFTYGGLAKLDVAGLDDADVEAFRDGMAARTDKGILTDPPPDGWVVLGPNSPVDGVFIVTGISKAEIANTIALQLAPVPGNGWVLDAQQHGQVRPAPAGGHEHFGYADGVSQPGVRGRLPSGAPLTETTGTSENQGEPGQDLLWPGEFLFGYPEQDPTKTLEDEGPVHEPPIEFMRNGAYLVFRRLAQLVPEFDQAVKDQAALTGGASDESSAELMGAQMVGRWKSGTALINAPTADNPGLAEGTPLVNDFEFGDDREGLHCPWAAHVRKVYPRDDVRGNTDPDQDAIDAAEAATQTHRMLRRGIAFGPELTEKEALSGSSSTNPSNARGLLFKSYVTSLDDQFEFVQQAWVNNPDFSQPDAGVDPIIGQSDDDTAPFLGAAATSGDATKKPQLSMGHFVTMEGGEYFFAPSITAIESL